MMLPALLFIRVLASESLARNATLVYQLKVIAIRTVYSRCLTRLNARVFPSSVHSVWVKTCGN